MTVSSPSVSSALVVAHPAHELRLVGWMARARPAVSVLTTGSRNGQARDRIERTGELVAAVGARRGSLFGATLDRDLYAAVMGGEVTLFQEWIVTLCADFVRDEVELIVTDGWQGYSPAHDLTHLIARLAASRAGVALGRPVRVVEYAVVPVAITPLHVQAWPAFGLDLDATEIAAKRAAIDTYPDIVQEAAEIHALDGPEGMATEDFFFPAPIEALLSSGGDAYYERVGLERVARGLYREVLCERHVAAVARALIADTPDAAPVAIRQDKAPSQVSV